LISGFLSDLAAFAVEAVFFRSVNPSATLSGAMVVDDADEADPSM
jgi:hypothetical protein